MVSQPATEVIRWWCLGYLPTGANGVHQPWVRPGSGFVVPLLTTRNPFRRLSSPSAPWRTTYGRGRDGSPFGIVAGPDLLVTLRPDRMTAFVGTRWLSIFALLSGDLRVGSQAPSGTSIRMAFQALPPDVQRVVPVHDLLPWAAGLEQSSVVGR